MFGKYYSILMPQENNRKLMHQLMQKILCIAEGFYQHCKQPDNNGIFFKGVHVGYAYITIDDATCKKLLAVVIIYNEVTCRYFSSTSFKSGSQVSIKSPFISASVGCLAKLK